MAWTHSDLEGAGSIVHGFRKPIVDFIFTSFLGCHQPGFACAACFEEFKGGGDGQRYIYTFYVFESKLGSFARVNLGVERAAYVLAALGKYH